MLKLLPEAYETLEQELPKVEQRELRKGETQEQARKAVLRVEEQQKNLLGAIEEDPVPFYAPTEEGRTVRLFGCNQSLLFLRRNIRKKLTQDFTTVDLRCAQLAIVARIWNIPLIEEFLATGKNVWEHLAKELNSPYEDEDEKDNTKAGLKKMVYALVYGGCNDKRGASEREGRQVYFGEPQYSNLTPRFMALPMIKALYQARELQEAKVIEDGGAYDAFGSWIPLQYRMIKDKAPQPRPQSVLACQAQSYELKLLWPIVEEALKSDRFAITVWLHDGLCLDFRDSGKKEQILRRLNKKVAQVASELQIQTELEFS